MLKTASITAVFVLSTGAFASDTATSTPRPENSTYVDGNVSSLKPNTGGTLVFSDEKSMTFRTGLADVAVPYAAISRAELGATQEHSHETALPGPLHAIKLPLGHKTETQLLTLEFKNGLGEAQTMTLSLAKPAAGNVLYTIEEHTGKVPEKSDTKTVAAKADSKDGSKDAWWGDTMWKTNRNQAEWAQNSGK